MPKKSAQYSRPIYIVDAARTPFLKAQGKPGPFSASDLAVSAGKQLLARQSFAPSDLDEVIAGCVIPGPDEANIARIIALRLGCGKKVPAYTVQRNCASGMQALDSACKDIVDGRAGLVLAGGCEAMSHSPLLFNKAMVNWLAGWYAARGMLARSKHLFKLRPHLFAPIIALLRGLRDPVVGMSMGQTAEELAYRFNISRQAMDEFALRSHEHLSDAIEGNHLSEITPLYAPNGKVYQQDTGLRADTTLEKLAKLKPYFDKKFGLVTAGNSAQITDGAAWMLLASEEAVKEHKLNVRGRLVACRWAALDPAQMGLGPVYASTDLLQGVGLKREDIDHWEINEAFAAQVLACQAAWRDKEFCEKELGLKEAFGAIDPQRLNSDGGAIAIGHPIGATGARIALHVLNVLERNQEKRGVATLCIGGGQGGAMLIERG